MGTSMYASVGSELSDGVAGVATDAKCQTELAATEKTESDVSAATETVFSEGRSDSAPSPVPSEGADDAPSVESGDLASPMIPSMARSDASTPWRSPVWKSNVAAHLLPRLNHDLHAIDATPARRRGGADSSPLEGASTAASSSMHATHWLISTQALALAPLYGLARGQQFVDEEGPDQ